MSNEYAIKSMMSVYTFIGTRYDLPKRGKIGDVCLVNGCVYVYDGTKWQDISMPVNEVTYIKHPTHCKCCGAILKSNICEYCGAEYYEE